MVKLRCRKYPELCRMMYARHEMYNAELAKLREWEADGRAFVIRPSVPIKMKRIEKDPEKLQEVYDLGVRDMNALIDPLLAYMEERNG